MLLNLLLVLFSFFKFSAAFYPLIPAYRCIYDGTCPAEKRSLQVAEGYTLKIVRGAAPINEIDPIIQVRAHVDQLAQKYVKKRGVNTHSVVTAATPTQTDSAGIDQDGTDYSYFAQVQLGSANTPLYMLLDTGASQTWVMGSTCTSEPCTNHNSFGAVNSTTFETAEGSWSVKYGSGSCSGGFGNDTLNLAGLSLPITLGIANTVSNDFNNFPMDGILGLSQATGQYPSFIKTLVDSKSLKSNLFAISLNRESDGPNTGEISFGSPDAAKYTGSISYTTVSANADGDWAIPMDGLSFSGNDAGITGKLAYIDTGTSYIFGPPAQVAQFHALVPGAKSSDDYTWTVPCTTTTPLTFTFSGVTYNVSSKDWVSPMANGVCTSNVYGNDIISGQWLLGDTFLKNVYVVFDIDGNRIGFALKPVSSSTSSSTSSSGGQTSSTSSSGGQTSSPSSSGGQTSSPSSTASSSATVSAGSTGSSYETTSNTGPTGSAQATQTAATTTGDSATSETGAPGLNGHQTSDSSGTAAAAESTTSATASATPTKKSAAAHLEIHFATILFATLALLTLSPLGLLT